MFSVDCRMRSVCVIFIDRSHFFRDAFPFSNSWENVTLSNVVSGMCWCKMQLVAVYFC